MSARDLKPETLAIHADAGIERAPDVAPPIRVSPESRTEVEGCTA